MLYVRESAAGDEVIHPFMHHFLERHTSRIAFGWGKKINYVFIDFVEIGNIQHI